MKFTTHKGDPRTVIQVSLTAIFTTRIVCSHLDGVLKDCVKLEVSHSLLACRVGVGGRGLLVLSVGGGVRDRGRGCAGIFSCCSLFWVLQWFGATARRTAVKTAQCLLPSSVETRSACPAVIYAAKTSRVKKLCSLVSYMPLGTIPGGPLSRVCACSAL